MTSQVALHEKLINPFEIIDCRKINDLQEKYLSEKFEDGKILVFDNLNFSSLDYFLEQPGKQFTNWVPPLFTTKILKTPKNIDQHVLGEYYDKQEDIFLFQENIRSLEKEWCLWTEKFFPFYEWSLKEFSYRFNHMDLGVLHLDIPDESYSEHQFRWFINLDNRPRILAIGPTIYELAEMYWEEKSLSDYLELENRFFIEKIRNKTLDETINKERELPRHYLTLDPGSMWLAHSSYVSHGLVYGRKTACLEGHIKSQSLLDHNKDFHSQLNKFKKDKRCLR